jgi:hypothetical protein
MRSLLIAVGANILCNYATAVPCAAGSLSDGIAALSGDAEIVSPPPSGRRQAYESDDAVRVFLERELLVSSVPINAVQPGIYNAYADFDDQVVSPAGKVRSYFLHFDGIGTALRRLMGSLTFDAPILGVIGRSLTLEQTDADFGSPGTLYPTDRFDREPEFQGRDNYDYFQISGDKRTLSFRWEVTTDVDQLRVVTAVPEPPAFWAFIAMTLGCMATAHRGPQKRRIAASLLSIAAVG